MKRDSVEVMFRARLTETPTVFDALVLNSRQEDNQQGVVPAEFDAQQVFLPDAISSRKLVRSLNHTSTFTPNGDGVNDRTSISYTLLRLTSAVPVSIRIVDLSGHLVRRVFDGDDSLGEHTHSWDGTDDSGRLVPPGLYLCLIEADVQQRRETTTALLCVAY